MTARPSRASQQVMELSILWAYPETMVLAVIPEPLMVPKVSLHVNTSPELWTFFPLTVSSEVPQKPTLRGPSSALTSRLVPLPAEAHILAEDPSETSCELDMLNVRLLACSVFP